MPRPPQKLARFTGFFCLGLLAVLFLSACHTPPALKPVDLSSPEWRVRNGQAVWKTSAHGPELAGDLLLATTTNGSMFLQFSKTPFPLVTAQTQGELWRVDFGANNSSYGGRGKPTTRISWFELASALEGGAADHGWIFQDLREGRWQLGPSARGEVIRGYLEK